MATWEAKDGTLINYELYGENSRRENLLLLPGLLGSISTQWQSFVKALLPTHRVILMDLRGHGRSTNAADTLHAEDMLNDVLGLLDMLQVTAVHIAGYSLGGYLGLMAALSRPKLVTTLLMHATKFYWTPEAVKAMRAQLDPDTMAQKVPTYADQLAQEHGGRNWRGLVRQAGDLIVELSQKGITEKMAANTQCPVLVSVGEKDSLVSILEAQRLAQVMPHGELLVLPGVRHPFQTIRAIPLLPMMQHFHRRDYGTH